MTLTADRVRELLNYDAETGQFTWRVDRTGKARVGARRVVAQGQADVACPNNSCRPSKAALRSKDRNLCTTPREGQ